MKRKHILMVYKFFGIELFHLTSEKIKKIKNIRQVMEKMKTKMNFKIPKMNPNVSNRIPQSYLDPICIF